jgi:quercetin dioxygenase-like cupin family protein
MAIAHAEPGEVVDILADKQDKTAAIFKTQQLEVIRMVLPEGKKLPSHRVPGEIVVHCVEGRVAFTARGRTQELRSGQILHLMAGDEHSVEALDHACLLVTIALG